MNTRAVRNFVHGAVKRIGFKLKKHAPEIFIAMGVTGFIGTTVSVYQATRKIDPILQDAKENIELIKEYAENDPKKYTDKKKRKDLALVYLNTGAKLAKLYGPSVFLGTLSISSVLASNGINRNRNASLAAAYATINTSLKEYRKRFADKYGEEAEKELRYGIQTKKIEDVVLDENGKEKKIKSVVKVADSNIENYFTVFFDSRSRAWDTDPDYNISFLRRQESYMNDKLRADKFVFLNDVFEAIGLPKTKAGQKCGWIYDENNSRGDNYISFGIYETRRSCCKDKLNGVEQAIILEFNVDGPIIDLFEEPK